MNPRFYSLPCLLLLGLGLAAVSLISPPQAALAYSPQDLDRLRRTNACPGCDLSFADLSGWKLRGADLTGANLTATNLRNANLRQATLTMANLNHADLTKANLSQANLQRAILVFSRLENAILNQANLSQAILGGRDRLSTVQSLDGAILPNGRPAVERRDGLISL